MKNWEREYDDDEPRKPRYMRCRDRMCGADDCPNCHPENFRGGVFIDNQPDDDKKEHQKQFLRAPHGQKSRVVTTKKAKAKKQRKLEKYG